MADLLDWSGEEHDYFDQRRRNGENVEQMDYNSGGGVTGGNSAVSLTRKFEGEPHVTFVDGLTG
jgi:hypothetical protein